MLTTYQLIAQAAQDANVPGFLAQGLTKLNTILDEICLNHDFALSRGVYYFNLNPTLITTIAGFTNFGGPYPLPLDYLRTSGSSGSDGTQYSFFYVYNGVPYPLMPWDLGRMDMQVQTPGIQNLPYAFATDISPESTVNDRIAGTIKATTTAGSATITIDAYPNPSVPMANGMGVSGLGIAPGSVAVNVSGAPTIVLSLAATGTFASLSSVIMYGTAPNAYVYPGPSGAFATSLRYQRLMPPILDAASPRIPWFTDQAYLLERLTAELMVTSDDERRTQLLGIAAGRMAQYDRMADDKTNRAQVVQFDRARFGRAFERLPNTKTVGW